MKPASERIERAVRTPVGGTTKRTKSEATNIMPRFVRVFVTNNLQSYRATATVVANRSNVSTLLNSILERGEEKLKNRAFLHHYKQYGCEEDDFEESFNSVFSVINAYEEAFRL